MSATVVRRRGPVALVAYALAFVGFVGAPGAHAEDGNYFDRVGYTALQAELGAAMPTGAGIGVSLVEAMSGGAYMPDASQPQFAGKVFTDMSQVAPGTSSHADNVGAFWFGSVNSIAPGITDVHCYEGNNWLEDGMLGHLSSPSVAPLPEVQRIINCSWISTSTDTDELIDVSRRLDYAIERDGYTALVTVNNGSSESIPGLLAHAYNLVSVGRTDGQHSHGLTFYDEAGRIKPEIVAPMVATSWAAPLIAGGVALLMETAEAVADLTAAVEPESIKAILLAGATKAEFPDWDRTETRPLDDVYGAGEFNIRNSYHVLAGGEQDAGGIVTLDGWDHDDIDAGDSTYYYFEVPEQAGEVELSVALTWNRIVSDGMAGDPWGDPTAGIADLGLELYAASGFETGLRIDASLSPVDNVEYLWAPSLTPGEYAVRVVPDGESGSTTEYALAWHGTVVPEPSVIALTLAAAAAAARRRRVRA